MVLLLFYLPTPPPFPFSTTSESIGFRDIKTVELNFYSVHSEYLQIAKAM